MEEELREEEERDLVEVGPGASTRLSMIQVRMCVCVVTSNMYACKGSYM